MASQYSTVDNKVQHSSHSQSHGVADNTSSTGQLWLTQASTMQYRALQATPGSGKHEHPHSLHSEHAPTSVSWS
jgi:hypothetical protein